MRLYVNNDSYPELRDILSRWERHRTWWRAFGSAFRDRRLWLLALSHVVVVAAGVTIDAWLTTMSDWPAPWTTLVHGATIMAIIFVNGVIALSWGGDIMRPHLRRVSPIARRACPACGYQQHGGDRPDEGAPVIVCTECGAAVPRSVYQPPYDVPVEFRAFRWPFTP